MERLEGKANTMKKQIGQGWYHHSGQWHPAHEAEYVRVELPLDTYQKLNCKIGVYKAVRDALSTFIQKDKRLFWLNFSIKTHSQSDYHIIRPRVSIANDASHSWRLIVALYPDTGLIDVLIVSPTRDYEQINEKIKELVNA